MSQQRQPRIEKVVAYVQQNADRNLTYTEISEATGCPRGSLSSVLSRLAQNDTRLQKVAKSVVRYNSTAQPHQRGDTLLFEVVRDDDEKKLVIDEEGQLWAIYKFGEY